MQSSLDVLAEKVLRIVLLRAQGVGLWFCCKRVLHLLRARICMGKGCKPLSAYARQGGQPKPQYETIRRNVYVSRPRPKRLPKDDIPVCNCCSFAPLPRPPPLPLRPASAGPLSPSHVAKSGPALAPRPIGSASSTPGVAAACVQPNPNPTMMPTNPPARSAPASLPNAHVLLQPLGPPPTVSVDQETALTASADLATAATAPAGLDMAVAANGGGGVGSGPDSGAATAGESGRAAAGGVSQGCSGEQGGPRTDLSGSGSEEQAAPNLGLQAGAAADPPLEVDRAAAAAGGARDSLAGFAGQCAEAVPAGLGQPDAATDAAGRDLLAAAVGGLGVGSEPCAAAREPGAVQGAAPGGAAPDVMAPGSPSGRAAAANPGHEPSDAAAVVAVLDSMVAATAAAAQPREATGSQAAALAQLRQVVGEEMALAQPASGQREGGADPVQVPDVGGEQKAAVQPRMGQGADPAKAAAAGGGQVTHAGVPPLPPPPPPPLRDCCGENCLNRLSYILCDPRMCPAGERCSNR